MDKPDSFVNGGIIPGGGTLRVIGDDLPGTYIPIGRSPRSAAILAETLRRMGIEPPEQP